MTGFCSTKRPFFRFIYHSQNNASTIYVHSPSTFLALSSSGSHSAPSYNTLDMHKLLPNTNKGGLIHPYVHLNWKSVGGRQTRLLLGILSIVCLFFLSLSTYRWSSGWKASASAALASLASSATCSPFSSSPDRSSGTASTCYWSVQREGETVKHYVRTVHTYVRTYVHLR